jgi:hypothetical protein
MMSRKSNYDAPTPVAGPLMVAGALAVLFIAGIVLIVVGLK